MIRSTKEGPCEGRYPNKEDDVDSVLEQST